ncbi:UPF0481 protein [Actinidia chinensis var. chinensis]|uniref:UPF0481 protein n=1 Tax=Actinidia chinensis var. chinensis TaxID=1590841 RepID=A0A2R6S1B0_ACTCC|nr:UPF0481 protein [Actinidia chinensis var. chinensis]
MVAVFNKELLSWYLITVKLKETVDAGIQRAQSPTGTRSVEYPDEHLQKQQQQQHQPLDPLRVVINGGDQADNLENSGPKPPKSEWVITIEDKLEQTRLEDVAGAWAKLCIYRVPQCLRESYDKAYKPQTVSLGPYHHGRRRLRSMNHHKDDALDPTGHDNAREPTSPFRTRSPIRPPIRSAGTERNGSEASGTILRPLNADEPLSKSVMNKLKWSLGHATTFDPFSDQGGLHCLDIFRRSLLQTGPKPEPRIWIKRWFHTRRVADKRRQQLIHCVTELSNSGIKFKKRKTDRFWDVKFKNGILRIPRLLIPDGTKSLFLNLISFEQCHLDSSNDITSYVIFMDNLINSPADVAYLHYHGIIEHWLGSNAEVADLFNRLCEEVVFDFNDSYLSRLSEQVNQYCNHRWNAWRASLKHTYFNNPWAIISFVAAVVLLLLTLAQTFCGVYGYYNPR